MRPHPSRRSCAMVLIPLLCLWPLLQAQGQAVSPTPPAPPAMDCAHAAPPPPPPSAPPHAAMRERQLQKALSLNAEQARQLDKLLSQAHEQHQPPDETGLARLLNPEQRRRLQELPSPPPPPPPPPLPSAADTAHGSGAACPRSTPPSPPAQRPPAPTQAASRPAD